MTMMGLQLRPIKSSFGPKVTLSRAARARTGKAVYLVDENMNKIGDKKTKKMYR